MRLFRQPAGVISPGPCWVLLHGCWLYCADTLPGVLWQALTQWKDDRHLAY